MRWVAVVDHEEWCNVVQDNGLPCDCPPAVDEAEDNVRLVSRYYPLPRTLRDFYREGA